MTTASATPRMTFGKKEHVVSKKTLERLFNGSNRSMVAYPIRMVYMSVAPEETPVKVLVSVSKRHFKRAVKRNRVKRQIREAYRRQKAELATAAAEANLSYNIAFIYMSDELHPSSAIHESVGRLLTRLSEKTTRRQEAEKTKDNDENRRQ